MGRRIRLVCFKEKIDQCRGGTNSQPCMSMTKTFKFSVFAMARTV